MKYLGFARCAPGSEHEKTDWIPVRVEEIGDQTFAAEVHGEPIFRGTALTVGNHLAENPLPAGALIKSALGDFRGQECPIIYVKTPDPEADQVANPGCNLPAAVIYMALRALHIVH